MTEKLINALLGSPWFFLVSQRMAYFLKDRWQTSHPTSIYRSKGSALDLFLSPQTRGDFRRLYDVIYDVVTLPEYIQSQLSQGGVVEGRKVGKLRGAKTLEKLEAREGTPFQTKHELDMAALIPMAAAFRELLVLRGDRYRWGVRHTDILPVCAEQLYKVLLARSQKAKLLSHLGADPEYWGACAQIVLRANNSLRDERDRRAA